MASTLTLQEFISEPIRSTKCPNSEIDEEILRYFYVDFYIRSANKFLVYLKEDCIYGIYILSNSRSDKIKVHIEGLQKDKGVKSEMNCSCSSKTKISPKKTMDYSLTIENSSSKKTRALVALTLKESKINATDPMASLA